MTVLDEGEVFIGQDALWRVYHRLAAGEPSVSVPTFQRTVEAFTREDGLVDACALQWLLARKRVAIRWADVYVGLTSVTSAVPPDTSTTPPPDPPSQHEPTPEPSL